MSPTDAGSPRLGVLDVMERHSVDTTVRVIDPSTHESGDAGDSAESLQLSGWAR
jgi:hypothetical protein